jgi:hypothetical protein
MDWKGLRDTLVKVGLPVLANAVAPGSGAIVSLVTNALGLSSSATPDEIAAAAVNPDNLVKLRELQDRHEEILVKAAYDAENAALGAVNQTMQAEAANAAHENWWQKGWRPFNGYVVGLGALAATVLVCWLMYVAVRTGNANALQFIPALAFNIGLILSIPGAAVGITAWHRGVLQREQAKNGNGDSK